MDMGTCSSEVCTSGNRPARPAALRGAAIVVLCALLDMGASLVLMLRATCRRRAALSPVTRWQPLPCEEEEGGKRDFSHVFRQKELRNVGVADEWQILAI